MRLLVCGGRDYEDSETLAEVLDAFAEQYRIEAVIEGEAPGADSLARDWAERRAIPVEKYPADWDRYGKAAGPLRNERMLTEGKPDLVLAFPGGRGTANMVEQARAAGVRVALVDEALKR